VQSVPRHFTKQESGIAVDPFGHGRIIRRAPATYLSPDSVRHFAFEKLNISSNIRFSRQLSPPATLRRRLRCNVGSAHLLLPPLPELTRGGSLAATV
jgi:hypothetical protein